MESIFCDIQLYTCCPIHCYKYYHIDLLINDISIYFCFHFVHVVHLHFTQIYTLNWYIECMLSN